MPVLSGAEARELLGLVDGVEQRLRPWWQAEGERSVKVRIRRVGDAARRHHMTQALGRMAAFLESAPPSRDAYVHAIAPPEPASKDSNATAIFNHLPLEFVDAADDPDVVVHGAVHEICHYLYDYIPADKHPALADEFVASGAPSVAGIYSYLHEAMAISAQELYADALEKDGSGVEDDGDTEYRHPYIPVLASAAAPLVKAAVARNEHLVGGFSKSYLAAALSKLADRRNELPFVFAQAVLVTTSGDRGFADAFQRTLFPVGTVRFTDLAKAAAFPDTNLVQFSAYAELGAIAEPQVARLRDTHRGFAFASRRGRGGYHLIVAGRSADDMLAVIAKLGEADGLAGPGLVVSVD